MGFSNMIMNGVLQLIQVFSGIGQKSGYGVTPEDMVFRDKMYQVFRNIWMKKIIAIY